MASGPVLWPHECHDRLVSRGAHAAAVRDLIGASRGRDARLGAITDGNGSFPPTDVGLLHADKMLRAAFTSRSCMSPHALQLHALTTSLSGPVGPVRDPQPLQARVVLRSLTR